MHGSEEINEIRQREKKDKGWKVDLSIEYCLDAHMVLELKSKTMWLITTTISKVIK